MQSKFHIACSSPEDLRRELLSWLNRRATSDEDYAQHIARTKRSQLIHITAAKTYREIMEFWKEIVIDARETPPEESGKTGDDCGNRRLEKFQGDLFRHFGAYNPEGKR